MEFWLARDLQHLLGYTKWDNFLNVVSKAKTACEVSGYLRTILPTSGKWSTSVPVVVRSGRYHADPLRLLSHRSKRRSEKQEIAFAQTYFNTLLELEKPE